MFRTEHMNTDIRLIIHPCILFDLRLLLESSAKTADFSLVMYTRRL